MNKSPTRTTVHSLEML